jgi:endonuclease YncB( thermonuclease family)
VSASTAKRPWARLLKQAYCEDLYRAEVKAKRDKVGMWAQGARYESPRAYRQRMKIRGE